MLLSSASAFIIPHHHHNKPLDTTVSIIRHRTSSALRPVVVARLLPVLKKKPDDEEDDDESSQTGMNEAFRQLGSLDSLGDPTEGKESTVKLDDQSKQELLSQENKVSMEQEVELFKGLLKDSEESDEDTLYSDVIKDMGGTPKEAPKAKPQQQITIEESGTTTTGSAIPRSEEDTQKFMDQAIQEALDEARSMAPDGKKLSDSILDDEEIMKEIEEIFEKGNEKLLASLEEIREEQQELARISAEQRSKVAMDNSQDEETAKRLAAAEASMQKQLGRVNQERAEVEQAVADLQKVKEELDAEASGNVIKPAALAGVLLFSVRSLLDFVAMGGIDSEAHLTAALIQGAIALACGAYLVFA
ncbi:expressed unknown protein [Seminavis robusta]|uniref:Uncharacterized protein n=1 Tax=Seminavis robusta TaxID=568900 RepID=A0A9N8DJB3_9STRA|nr:expressed unknown protein [Seminavis robusta]|eukprot:Sro113_g055990.1 n/a (360) ;mRNA; r:36372-37561